LGRDDAQNKYTIHPWHVARAYYLGMIEKDALYECILDTHLVNGSFWHTNNDTRLQQAYAIAYFQNHYQKVPTIDLRGYKVEGKEVDTKVIMILREALEDIVNTLLKIEQQRLIEKSEATPYLLQNKVFPGIKYLVLALKEIATSTITRGNDTYSRTAIFVEVIKHSYPLASDTSALLAKANIREERLVEVAMLAPQWIDIISEVIKWDGFKEACYYFIAHIKDYNNEEKKAEIAHYTALDPSDLNDGAFDREWCKEVYATLGKQRFKLIYQAAKFLCDNAFHARARKYADACMGNIAKEELLKQVQEKRNKDSLNAYCICEIKDDKDLLERYMVVQKFAKEAKQFGAQRRASEKRASDIAMLNLARNSRFESVTRLQWFLEKEMISQVADVLEPNKIEDIEIWIAFDAEGKNEVKVSKAGKALKAVPARLKKQVDVIRILDIHKQWNEQYKRSRMMLEKAMNERSVFSKEEITMMMDNPIAAPMMKKLVLKSGQSVGFYKGTNGYTLLLTDEVYIAHPYDLYQMGVWQDYQTYIFEQQLVQPFKQVFRELYLKLEEELEFTFTRRYSGYQIQTKKAATTLRTRGWNADYENGLEKVDYRFNTVVNLYANADWFSPNDIEAPSIDYVGFHERLKRDSMKVKNVDDVTFSEAMRDVDLAISTAYVGGVDPLTTTSTIAMRKAIVTYTLKLMNIDTVEVQDNFANIKGHLNNYSVHLGSGMVHQSGGAAIHMIPIFNGKRGNVYLPFLDEDPKTAEIVSKIIMLAEDNKIKDVSILKQIKS
jgi:predicted nucleotidyltransferase